MEQMDSLIKHIWGRVKQVGRSLHRRVLRARRLRMGALKGKGCGADTGCRAAQAHLMMNCVIFAD